MHLLNAIDVSSNFEFVVKIQMLLNSCLPRLLQLVQLYRREVVLSSFNLNQK